MENPNILQRVSDLLTSIRKCEQELFSLAEIHDDLLKQPPATEQDKNDTLNPTSTGQPGIGEVSADARSDTFPSYSHPAHSLILDIDGSIMAMDESWPSLTGTSPGSPVSFNIGENFFSMLHQLYVSDDGNYQMIADGIKSVLRSEKTHFSTQCQWTRQGTTHPDRLEAYPLTITTGRGVRITLHDATTEHAEADSLQHQKKQLLQLLSTVTTRLNETQAVANVGSWETDLVTFDVSWSDETFRIFGVNPKDFYPSHEKFLGLVHPEDRDTVDNALLESLGQTGQFSVNHRISLNDGSIKYIEERWESFNDQFGKSVRAVGTCRDITVHVIATQKLEQRARQQSLMAKLGLELAKTNHFQVVLDLVVQAIAQGLNIDLCKILQITQAGDSLLVVSGCGWNPNVVGSATVSIDENSQAGYTLKVDKIVTMEDSSIETRFKLPSLLLDHGVQAGISFPIKWLGEPWGVLGAHHRSRHKFNDNDIHFLESVASLLSVAIDRLAYQQTLNDSEVRMLNAQRLANLGYWESDLTSKTFICSDQLLRIFGISNNEDFNSYDSLLALIHPEDLTVFKQQISELGSTKDLIEINHRILTAEGDVRFVSQRIELRQDGHDASNIISAAVIDNTNQTLLAEERERVFSLSTDLLSVASFDGRLEQVNPAWSRCLGWDQDYITSLPWLHFVHPDDHQATVQAAEVLLSGEELRNFENRYLCRDGSYRWLSWNCHPMPETRQVFSIARDVTDLRSSITQLRQSEERFRLMIEGSGSALFFTYDHEQRFSYLSPSTQLVLGYNPVELLGRHRDEILYVNPQTGQPGLSTQRPVGDTTVSEETYTLAVKHKDGHKVLLEVTESPASSEDRLVAGQGFARDITKQIQAQEKLVASENRFRGLFEQAAVGIVFASEDGRFLRVNDRFCEIVGYNSDDLVNKLCAAATHPDDRTMESHYLGRLLDNDLTNGSWEKRYLRADGTSVWCNLTLSMLPETELEPRQFIGIIEDISNKKEAQQRLEQKQSLLKIASRISRLGGWEFDVNTQTLIWSPEVRAIYDVKPDFSPNLDNAISFHLKRDRAMVRELFEKSITNGEPFDVELEMKTAKGDLIWVRSIGEPARDENNKIVKVQGAFQDISARKQAEASLTETQRRFRLMADAFPFMIWTGTAEGKINYTNQTFLSYSGIDPDVPPESRWQPIVHADDLSNWKQLWADSLFNRRSYEAEYRLRSKDGQYRWHRIDSSPVLNTSGEVVEWFGTALDVHDSKILEQQATRLATQLNDTLESITDGFFILDSEWNFSFLNAQAETMLQRERKELINQSIWNEFPDATGTLFEKNYRKARDENTAVHFEAYYPGQLQLWFSVSAYPSEDGLAVYFRDTTSERSKNAQLKLLETAVSRLNDIVLITEAEPFAEPGPRIVFVNEAFERRTGYTREEVLGKTPRILQGKKTQRSELDRIRKALERWQPVRAELINYTKSGEEFWLELDIVPIADETGWYTHWVAVERDITERRRFEEQLRESQRLESVGQLTGGIAHDFNNLLTVIIGNTEFLQDQLSDSHFKELAKMAMNAGLRGAELTRRLLAFARRQPLDPKVVDVNALIASMEEMLRRTLGEDIQISTSYDKHLWKTQIDPGQLENAVLNLCINARDAMASGGRLVIETTNTTVDDNHILEKIQVSRGDYVTISVTDNGAGMDKETQERVFEPFFTTKEHGKGTGLGLAMIYGFIKQSGGHISLYSEPGLGTTLKLYLRRSDSDQVTMDTTQTNILAENGFETILLVEDDDLVREYADNLLQGLGYKVIIAENGSEALKVLESGTKVDLLFTDIVMPGMSGHELKDKVSVINPKIKILCTSGYSEDAIKLQGRLNHGVQVISKPYRRSDLAVKLRSILDN